MTRSRAIAIATLIPVAIFVVDGFYKFDLASHARPLFWAYDFAKFVVLPGAGLWWLYSRFRVRPADYGLRRESPSESGWRFVGLVLTVTLLLSAIYFVASAIGRELLQPPSRAFHQEILPGGWARYPVAAYLSITAGVTEEVLFRGLPYLYCRERFPERFPATAYVLSTSIAFGAAHFENGSGELLATAIFGLAAAALFLKLRNLWPLVLAHTVTDLVDLL